METPLFNVRISKTAEIMLTNHIEFLAAVQVTAAYNLKNTILSAIKTLREHPHRHPLFEREASEIEYRKMPVAARYVILYYIERNEVIVDYILDCRQDNNKYFIGTEAIY